MMRIIQLLPTISYGDAVSNDVLAIRNLLIESGYSTEIYAENIDKRLSPNIVNPIKKLKKMSKNDIIIYHLSTGTKLNYKMGTFLARKIVIYHNITPSHFFCGYSSELEQLCREGLMETEYLNDKVEYVLADSSFNKEELVKMGYKINIDVLPIIIPFEDYDKNPNDNILNKYKDDGYTNILFTGRMAPNKKQEDVIKAFYYYHNYINKKSRLFLVGSCNGLENYDKQLKRYVKLLELDDVIFTGHVKFDEILAYYKIADLFLCMSEHEGFCVPLVEAMCFEIPIIAYDNCAIGETLGGGGILLKEKDPIITAELINRILKDTDLKSRIIMNQKERLEYFSNKRVKKLFMNYLKKFIGD